MLGPNEAGVFVRIQIWDRRTTGRPEVAREIDADSRPELPRSDRILEERCGQRGSDTNLEPGLFPYLPTESEWERFPLLDMSARDDPHPRKERLTGRSSEQKNPTLAEDDSAHSDVGSAVLAHGQVNGSSSLKCGVVRSKNLLEERAAAAVMPISFAQAHD